MWSKPILMPDLYKNIALSLKLSLPCCSISLTETSHSGNGSFGIWQNFLKILEVVECRPMALWYFNNMTPAYPKWFVYISHISKIKMWFLEWDITFPLVTILLQHVGDVDICNRHSYNSNSFFSCKSNDCRYLHLPHVVK